MSAGEGPLLSPQARTLFEAALAVRERIDATSVEDGRRAMREEARAFGGEPEAVAAIEDLDAGGVPARLYRPGGGETDVLVWLHGGGWVRGDADCYEALCCALANRAGCAVLSVEYRRVPEHRYPAAIEDAWTATEWALERFAQVAVGGDSAGGNLAAAVALRARDAGLALALQLLVYPMLDPGVDSPFVDDFVARYATLGSWEGFGPEQPVAMRGVWELYVPDGRLAEQDAAPARAVSLAGVAPAAIVLAEHDVLRGEGEAYARRLVDEGVTVELHVYPRQVHGFYHLLAAIDDARDAVERSAAALRRVFSAARRRA